MIFYLQLYLSVFHENQDIFLHFHTSKKIKGVAGDAYKTLLQEQMEVQVLVLDLTALEKARL